MIDIDPLPVAAPGTTLGQSPGDSAAFASALDEATTAVDAQVADDTGAELADDAEVDSSAAATLELAFTAALAPTTTGPGPQPTTIDDAVVSSDTADPGIDAELAAVTDAGPEVATPDAPTEMAVSDRVIDDPEPLAESAAALHDVAIAAPVVATAVPAGDGGQPMLVSSEPESNGEGNASVDVDLVASPTPEATSGSSPQGDTTGDTTGDEPAPAELPIAAAAPAGEAPVAQTETEAANAPMPTVASGEAAIVAEAAAAETAAPAPTPTATPRVDAPAPAMNPAAMAEPTTQLPVDPVAVADMPSAPPATADLDAPPPAQQLAEALRDVRRMSDGSHRLSLQLHPEELGAVQLEVAVRDGQLHLRAVAETDATRRLLTASIPELREQLTDAGVSAGSLEVGAESAADHQRADAGDDGNPSAPQAPEDRADGPTTRPTTPIRLDAGQLDVQL